MNKFEVLESIEILRKYNAETEKIEAKAALDGFPKKCYDTLSSFSNKGGGIIIFGISEEKNFEAEGVYDINDLQKQITNLCSDAMEPPLRPNILSLEFEGKNILAVKVTELPQNQKPCYYKPSGLKNGSYIRVGERDDRMTNYELYSLQSYNEHIIEDTRPNKRAKINNLNSDLLKSYITKLKSNKPHFSNNDYNECLKLCGIVDSNQDDLYPTLAGTLIFCDYPQNFYPQLFVACIVVPGTEIGDIGPLGERFIDNKRVEGTIEEMLDETMNFLRRNMKTSIIIDEDGKRINRSEYPLEALREAVANALIHRDYSIQTENAYISVNMYTDRIEILSPGTLFGSNKLEKLGTATTMEARNPNIVRILEEKGAIIENRHSGIPTMKREMKNYHLPEPEFYEERDSFKVVFRNGGQQNAQVDNKMSKKEPSGQQSGQQNAQVDNKMQKKEPSGQQSGQQNAQVDNKMQKKEPSGQQSGQQNAQVDNKMSKKESSGQQNEQQNAQVDNKMPKKEPSGQQSDNKILNLTTNDYQNMILEFCKEPKTAIEIKKYLKIKSRQYVSTKIIKPLIDTGSLEYTNKNNINARNQKYISK